MAKKNQSLVASIDIGSSNIIVLIAEKDGEEIHIIGIGSAISDGIKKGIVVNIQSAVVAVTKAISTAANMSGFALSSITSGMSGLEITGINSEGRISIGHELINHNDVMRALQSTRAINLAPSTDIIYSIPQSYVIDGDTQVDDPVGMSGENLEARVYVVINKKSSIENIRQSIYQSGLNIDAVVPNIVAASHALLNTSDKKLGTCLIDIGGGTTDIVVFSKGVVVHLEVLSLSGNEVIDDVAFAFGLSQEVSKEIIKTHGCALPDLVDEANTISMDDYGDTQNKILSKRLLSDVIFATYNDIFLSVKKSLRDHTVASFVITGGGSKIKGCAELAETVFSKPAKIATLQHDIPSAENISEDQSYAVAIGLLLEDETAQDTNNSGFGNTIKSMFSKLFSKL